MIAILEAQGNVEMNIHELFLKTQDQFSNADEFVYSLDVLYILDMIEMDFNSETVKYVKGNKL